MMGGAMHARPDSPPAADVDSTGRRSLELAARVFLALAFLWLAFTACYVFLVLNGQRVHRVETAAFILAAAAIAAALVVRPKPAVEIWPAAGAVLLGSALLAWLAASARTLPVSFLSDDFVFLQQFSTLRH